MTRKDFEAIAAILAAQYDSQFSALGERAVQKTALAMADFLATRNGNFKKDKFLEACKVGLE